MFTVLVETIINTLKTQIHNIKTIKTWWIFNITNKLKYLTEITRINWISRYKKNEKENEFNSNNYYSNNVQEQWIYYHELNLNYICVNVFVLQSRHFKSLITGDWIKGHTFCHPQKSRRAVKKSTLAYKI